MTRISDIHDTLELDHAGCADPACCPCACTACKRVWFAMDRPRSKDCRIHRPREIHQSSAAEISVAPEGTPPAHFSHHYVALGPNEAGRATLRLLGELIVEEHAVVAVNVDALPSMDCQLVHSEGMPREGPVKSIFIKLWTVACRSSAGVFYRKGDWNDLDHLLFGRQRSEEDKRRLVETLSGSGLSLAKWRVTTKTIGAPCGS